MSADAWIVIVSDGDPPEVPRRDFRRIGGRHLVSWTIAAALEAVGPGRVAVVTSDHELASLAEFSGARAVPSRDELGAGDGAIVLEVRSRWPFLSAATLTRAIAAVEDGASSVVSITHETRPILQRDGDAWVPDAGAAAIQLAAISGTRLGSPSGPAAVIELSGPEALEIRGFDDLEAARHWVERLSIVIRTDAARELGMGHVYRSLALAYELAPHRLRVVTSAGEPLGGQFFDRTPFEHVAVDDEQGFLDQVAEAAADLVILDLLDTDAAFIERIRQVRPGVKVVSFEDHGSGSLEVDLLVSDIYENPSVPRERQLVGITHALLSPAFETVPWTTREPADVSELLVLFGGTDPSGLAEKSLRALQAIGYPGHVTVVRGLGADPLDVSGYGLDAEVRTDVTNMAELMSTADLALSSAGRTLAELASVGVPTLCMAQNTKELRHTHSTVDNGVVLLGLGTEVADEDLQQALRDLIGDRARRAELRAAGLAMTRDRRNATVVDEILRRVLTSTP